MPSPHAPLLALFAAAWLPGCTLPAEPLKRVERVEQRYEIVIVNGREMDPDSGLNALRNIGMANGVIQMISERTLLGNTVIDATGCVVAPGFIDLNTYQHGDPLFRLRAADGVTTVLNLEDGAVDIAAYYDALQGRALINYGIAVDHESLRHIAQGDTTLEIVDGVNEARGVPELDLRSLTEDELARLETLVATELREGAVAIGFGVEYTPGATQSEILQMVELAVECGASAHLHVRDFDPTRDWDQLNEVLGAAIRTGGDLHINHLNSVFETYSAEALTVIDRARALGLSVTTECYPYTAGLTFIDSAIFDEWETWSDERFQLYEWPPTGERLTRASFAEHHSEGGVVILHSHDEAAQESALRDCLRHPQPMIASDGAWDDGGSHPRTAGTNTRVLGRYVREEGVLSLMEALRKMSLAPAQHLERRVPSMRKKGRVRVGADADLVVFDPAEVLDRATYREPTLSPRGMEAVLVAGIPVVWNRVLQDDVHPGRPIRAPRSD